MCYSCHVHFASVSILSLHETKVPLIPPKCMRYHWKGRGSSSESKHIDQEQMSTTEDIIE